MSAPEEFCLSRAIYKMFALLLLLLFLRPTSTKPQAEILKLNNVNGCNDISFGDHSILEGDRIPPLKSHGQASGRVIITSRFGKSPVTLWNFITGRTERNSCGSDDLTARIRWPMAAVLTAIYHSQLGTFAVAHARGARPYKPPKN